MGSFIPCYAVETTGSIFDDFEWTAKDYIFEVTWQALNVVDYLQTRSIAIQHEDFHENNYILGEYPSTEEVAYYFASASVFHLGVSLMMPTKYRDYWQSFMIGCTLVCIINNDSIGVKIRWQE